MQNYSGISPVMKASGQTGRVHFRFACPKFLRQTFHEFASHSIGQPEWAKAYYEHRRNDEKMDHHPAVLTIDRRRKSWRTSIRSIDIGSVETLRRHPKRTVHKATKTSSRTVAVSRPKYADR
jgi:hypothetical protein